jgi:hypothetical protein
VKQKVGTLIDEEIIRLAKRRAAEEGRPLNDVIQDALVSYLNRGSADPKERDAAYRLFCERPIRLSPAQFGQVLEEDAWES